MKKVFLGVAVFVSTLVVVSSATAQVQCNDFEILLFGRIWRVVSYYVQDDILQNPNEFVFLEPEGLAYRDGVLYVSGDRGEDEADGRLAVYNYSVSGLSYNGFIQMPNIAPDWWGPEGLTFNNSGSGYGSGLNQLVSVEVDEPNQAAVIDLTTGNISDRQPVENPEDITFLPGITRFATLTDKASSIEVTYYDQSLSPTGSSFEVAPASNGLAGVSASFGSWFTLSSQSGEVLIVTTKASPGNAILAYDTNGNQIGRQYDLPLEPKARIPFDGFTLLLPAFDSVEAIAVDQTNKVIFLGDEGNAMIHVLTPVRLAADLFEDGTVDKKDLGIFVTYWLDVDCDLTDWCSGCDIDHNTVVNFPDYAILAEQWKLIESY